MTTSDKLPTTEQYISLAQMQEFDEMFNKRMNELEAGIRLLDQRIDAINRRISDIGRNRS